MVDKCIEFCERCDKPYRTSSPNRHYCNKCIKEIQSESAKRRNLNRLGIEARQAKIRERERLK